MRWPFSRPAATEAPGSRTPFMAHPLDRDEASGEFPPETAVVFMCSTCGRTDLPEAGDWDPPICLECDAAINFDIEAEQLAAEW